MSVTQYEMRFSELGRHAIWLVPKDRERIKRFIDGLDFQLRLLMTREKVRGATFDKVVDIAQKIEMVRGQERVEREDKRPCGQGGFIGAPHGVPATSTRKQFPRCHGGLSQQRIQPSNSAPVTSPPTQSAQGEGQSARGCPRRGGKLGGGQAHFYALPARPDDIASDAVVTGIVSVCHRDASVLFDPGKANVVVDALSHRAESLGSLMYLLAVERPLALDVQALVVQLVRLDILEASWVLSCVVSRSSLYDRIRKCQYDDLHLLVLQDRVRRGDSRDVTIGYDDMLRMQGRICVPNVYGLRELILEEAHISRYSIHPGATKMYQDIR
ncbi:uncharacterized protein [Nicotiana tomentosiformis]|uniref:uncharacterized protein n=1 Tax=Nicotiana tomentosiformis TaxID=4098 RepID=UPI00388CB061